MSTKKETSQKPRPDFEGQQKNDFQVDTKEHITHSVLPVKEIVEILHKACILALPASSESKYPENIKWKQYQHPIAYKQFEALQNKHDGLCLITGKVSNNLEALDFDKKIDGVQFDELLRDYKDLVEAEQPGLFNKLVVERTQSGGRHILYCCPETTIPGNKKLSYARIEVDGPGEHDYQGQTYEAKQEHDGKYYIYPCIIETRGKDGLVVCCPTPGYELTQNDLANIPAISAAERDILLKCAKACNQHIEPEQVITGKQSLKNGDLRPGEDFNERGDILPILDRHGWTYVNTNGDYTRFRRPDKDRGCSACLIGERVFYVFSTSTKFEPELGYSIFAVYAILEHDGDYRAAARELAKLGYGNNRNNTQNEFVDPDIKNPETSQNNEELDLSSALVDAENFINIEIPPKILYLNPWLLSHQIIMVSGWRNSGKSMFVLSLLDNITKGQPFGPWNCEMTDSVLYADGEMVADDVIERLNGFGLGNRYSKLWIYNDYYASILGLPRANLLNPKWRKAMKKLLIDNNIKIWAVDNLASLSPGIDENSKADWDPINQWFLDLRYQGITSILVHHTGKGGQQRGTSSREDNIDISIGLERPGNYHTEDGAKFVCKFHKARIKTADLSSIKDYEFQLTEEKGRYQWTYRDEQADKKRQVLVMLDEGIAQKDIADELMVHKSYVTKVKNRATQDGLLRKDARLTQIGFQNCKENLVN